MLRTLTPALVAALALAAPAPAQVCSGPDGLDGPCWEPVDLQLPDLGDIVLPGAGICWNSCDPGVKDPIRVVFSSPLEVLCGHFRSDVKIETTTGALVLEGKATLDYTRTWSEVDPQGNEYQVWRFVTKVDFAEAAGAPATCWNPPCLGPPIGYDTCFWYGYVDYAERCGEGGFDNALALYHSCDDYAHNAFLSDRPAPPGGGFHPGAFFGIVAPDTAANPFDPGAVTAPRSGQLIAEAVRNVPDLPGQACIAEEPVAQGVLQLLGQACLCPISPSSVQSASRLVGSGSCPDPAGVPSSFQSLSITNLPLGFKWFDLVGTRLGSWTTNARYPGIEAPFAEEGFFVYHDSCAAQTGAPADTLDVFYGAKTTGGYNVLDAAGRAPLSRNFLDLASNYSRPQVVLPLVGSIRPTDHLIYVNVP